ncbi:hypothetical protein D3P08_07530 [Paenibacillus nanensis]|uniref:Uncharacterized protein n=1 Tax=Paenibacillus nanensis TaxID=393251 RepID=A0A3A1V3Z6_9BACL|nr:hypothetical protein [Paenibacillus nanensis]RIX54092.1 hypothetical protein D3P08_07530 [Paenibacillus nanensis]
MLTRASILTVGILSVFAGILYHASGMLINFSFLGIEAGSERETVYFWGKCSIALGVTLLAAMALRPKMKEAVNDAMLVALLALLFVIQVPPLFLWLLFMTVGGPEGTWQGLLLHAAITAFICAAFVTARRGLAGAANLKNRTSG